QTLAARRDLLSVFARSPRAAIEEKWLTSPAFDVVRALEGPFERLQTLYGRDGPGGRPRGLRAAALRGRDRPGHSRGGRDDVRRRVPLSAHRGPAPRHAAADGLLHSTREIEDQRMLFRNSLFVFVFASFESRSSIASMGFTEERARRSLWIFGSSSGS